MKIQTMRHADIDMTGIIITTDTGLTIGTPRNSESTYWQDIQEYLATGGQIDPVIIAKETEQILP